MGVFVLLGLLRHFVPRNDLLVYFVTGIGDRNGIPYIIYDPGNGAGGLVIKTTNRSPLSKILPGTINNPSAAMRSVPASFEGAGHRNI